MVEINRPEDSFDKNELDVEGHRGPSQPASGGARPRQCQHPAAATGGGRGEQVGDESDDTEGHRVLRNLPGDESDDTEGHRVLRQTPADDDDDDTEGHRVLR